MTTLALARTPERGTLVRAVCVREWREALGNRLLVAMTLLPPVVILAAGIGAVAAAAANPPSDRDVQAMYAAAPAVVGLDPKEAIQGFIATYFLILFLLIPIYWLVNMSLKTNEEIVSGLTIWPHHLTFDNYRTIFTDSSWYNGYINSIIYVVMNTVISLHHLVPERYSTMRPTALSLSAT